MLGYARDEIVGVSLIRLTAVRAGPHRASIVLSRIKKAKSA
jgi:hypothetical protein